MLHHEDSLKSANIYAEDLTILLVSLQVYYQK
jgi:hypothetical protein